MRKQSITDMEGVSELVPLVLLAGELGESIDTLVYRLGDELECDDIGLRSCTVETARRLIAKRDMQAAQMKQRQAESLRRLQELEAKQPKVQGIPAPIPAPLDSALAVLMSHDWKLEEGGSR